VYFDGGITASFYCIFRDRFGLSKHLKNSDCWITYFRPMMSLFLGCYLFQLLTQKCSEIFFDTVSNYFTVIERWHDVADIPCENENSCEKLTFAQLFTTLLLKL